MATYRSSPTRAASSMSNVWGVYPRLVRSLSGKAKQREPLDNSISSAPACLYGTGQSNAWKKGKILARNSSRDCFSEGLVTKTKCGASVNMRFTANAAIVVLLPICREQHIAT